MEAGIRSRMRMRHSEFTEDTRGELAVIHFDSFVGD